MWWQKLLLYGCIGMLIEVLFTSVGSLFRKNWKATGVTYLYMLPIYGVTALGLEAVSDAVDWPFYWKAFLYVPVIYGVEFLSGWVLQRTVGHIPWDYGKSHWTPMGLVNLKYAPFWLALAMAFDPISGILRRVTNFLAKVE